MDVADAFQGSSPPKSANALRFGILGAARIAPDALIVPVKSHPDVIVAAVAARDETKARQFAKQYGIGKVYFGKNGYQCKPLCRKPTLVPAEAVGRDAG